MNKILIVAATAAEIAPALSHFGETHEQVDFLVTGVGMVSTAFALGKYLNKKNYRLAINVGIAGAFNKKIALGEVVFVAQDSFPELGAEDGEGFLSIAELGFGKSHYRSILPAGDKEILRGIKNVDGITVNTVHGNQNRIDQLLTTWPVDVESMEGAAFYYACEQLNLPCIQIRSISNYVERRDREKWKIGLAVKNLNEWIISKMTF